MTTKDAQSNPPTGDEWKLNVQHIARQLTEQLEQSDLSVAAGRRADSCGQWVKNLKKAIAELQSTRDEATRRRHELYDSQREAGVAKRNLKRDEAKLKANPNDEDALTDREAQLQLLAELDARIHDQMESLDYFEGIVATEQADVREAIARLKECRNNHPYEHHCGEDGGPGIRRPDGKCYSWSELERRAAGD